jgi:hypothetical protein
MPMQTRRVQIIVTRNLRRRLASGEAPIDFGPLEMLHVRQDLDIPAIKTPPR